MCTVDMRYRDLVKQFMVDFMVELIAKETEEEGVSLVCELVHHRLEV